MTPSVNSKVITLPFNPTCKDYTAAVYEITPAQAQYILDYHNKDNRKICSTQVGKISRSIEIDNWMLDGQPVTFNEQGNLTEAQHRLAAIARWHDKDRTFKIIVVTGVALDCFTKCALAKPRRAVDEIQRKDKTALASEVAILGDLLKRRRGEKLSINNAVYHWDLWKEDIRKGVDLIDSFVTNTEKFSSQQKTLGAWATLCVNGKYVNEASSFLELLEEEVLNVDPTTRLTSDFITYWNENAVDLSNEGRLNLFYSLLCVALDRMIQREDGKIELDVTSADLQHDALANRGSYRKFLA
jgi:hypothetical protein